MPISGRLTDQIGGGPVTLVGLLIMTTGTIALTRLTAHTPYTVTLDLVVRGVGLGCSMMPSMAAAYASLSRAAVPRATTALNVLQRVGGAIGTALLAVVLQDQIKAAIPGAAGIGGGAIAHVPPAIRARIAQPLADVFAHTFWWAVALSAVALLPAVLLALRVRCPGDRTRSGWCSTDGRRRSGLRTRAACWERKNCSPRCLVHLLSSRTVAGELRISTPPGLDQR